MKLSWPPLAQASALLKNKGYTEKVRELLRQLEAETSALEFPVVPKFVSWPVPFDGAIEFVDFEERRLRDYKVAVQEYEAVFAGCASVIQTMRAEVNYLQRQNEQRGWPVYDADSATEPRPEAERLGRRSSSGDDGRWAVLAAQAEEFEREEDSAGLNAVAVEMQALIDRPPNGPIAPEYVAWPRPFVPWPSARERLRTMYEFSEAEVRRYRRYVEARLEYERMSPIGVEERKSRVELLARIRGRLAESSEPSASLQREDTAVELALVTPSRLAWTPLPAGKHPFAAVIDHFAGMAQSRPDKAFDLERLTKIAGLGPDQIWLGRDEFDGYAVFVFLEAGATVLDCPVYGNAIYVLEGEQWEALARRTKAQLLRDHSAEVRRIVHSGDWLKRLETRVVRNNAPNV